MTQKNVYTKQKYSHYQRRDLWLLRRQGEDGAGSLGSAGTNNYKQDAARSCCRRQAAISNILGSTIMENNMEKNISITDSLCCNTENVCLVARSCPTFFWPIALLSMGLSRQEYWSGLPSPSPRNLPDPPSEFRSPVLQVDSLLSEAPGKSL